MNIDVFKIRCLTNMHVGSGETGVLINNEVEKDPVTDYPVVHSSGIKGALRDMANVDADKIFGTREKENDAGIEGALKDIAKKVNVDVNEIFGKPEKENVAGSSGSYKFFDAKFIARPLRVSNNSERAYILTTTLTAINDFIEFAADFGFDIGRKEKISLDFDGKKFISSVGTINIEGEEAGSIKESDKDAADFIKKLIGDDFAVCEGFDEYPLPSLARNKLDKGTSENVWYEEFVPHHSLFWMAVLYPETFELDFSEPVQIGGNASIGNGYVRFEKINPTGAIE